MKLSESDCPVQPGGVDIREWSATGSLTTVLQALTTVLQALTLLVPLVGVLIVSGKVDRLTGQVRSRQESLVTHVTSPGMHGD
ncbi:MAG: hypothetical protein OXG35_04085 [Acidobacteria bacterium]|nr:hypothetical protein [Acidobacteriota bacterium]